MKINMFEGARRIAKLIAVTWVVGVFVFQFSSDLTIRAYFRVFSPDNAPVRVEGESGCGDDDAREYLFSQYTRKGTRVSLTFCFKPMIFDSGKTLIPYRADKATNMVWGDEKYSSNVSNYTSKVVKDFKLSAADEEWVEGKIWPARWIKIKDGAISIVIGLVFVWIFSWGVGWIVRGFAGIPSRLDRKPDDK